MLQEINKTADSYYHNIGLSTNYGTTLDKIDKLSYHQVISLIHRNICQN